MGNVKPCKTETHDQIFPLTIAPIRWAMWGMYRDVHELSIAIAAIVIDFRSRGDLNGEMSRKISERQRLARALVSIEQALSDNVERGIEVQRRVQEFHEQLTDGRSVHELISEEDSPRAVEMLTHNMTTLETVGSEFRANLAHALREEGLTIEAIADLFGVTRQRISALLRQRDN